MRYRVSYIAANDIIQEDIVEASGCSVNSNGPSSSVIFYGEADVISSAYPPDNSPWPIIMVISSKYIRVVEVK